MTLSRRRFLGLVGGTAVGGFLRARSGRQYPVRWPAEKLRRRDDHAF